MMMLRILIVCIFAGSGYAQSQGLYSDCDSQQSIIDDCSLTHLAYLSKVSSAQVQFLHRVSEIDDPSFVLDQLQLGIICNETGHLKQYYECVHANLTSCLQAANSTQARDLPAALTIARGIGRLCHSRHQLNKTCLDLKATDVETCFATFTGESDQSSDQCATYEELIRCTEKQSVCAGGSIIKDFVVSARPNGCKGTGTAVPLQAATSAVLLSAALLLHLVCCHL
ncbi:hypothetical protein ACOMHN_049427 [Nucella lapillus]